MNTFKLRLFAALVLVVSLWALRMGLTYVQLHGAWFWMVTGGFVLQAIACASVLLRSVTVRRTGEQTKTQPIDPSKITGRMS